MVEKADKKSKKATDNNVNIVYKIVNIVTIDDQLSVADRVKVIEREVKQNDSQEQ